MAAATKTAPKTVTVEMVLDKETPGSVRYADPTDGTVIPTLYLRKEAFADGTVPDTIKVVVTLG